VIVAMLFAAQLVNGAGTTRRSDTSTYASAHVQRVVDSAAASNERVPPSLGRYNAVLESEIAAGLTRGDGAEATLGLEQVASTLTWDRRGTTEQRVTGYRSQSVGPNLSSLGFFEYAWAVPILYGNRLEFMFGADTVPGRNGRPGRKARGAAYAAHPLASDRQQFYRFSGGDTIVTMRVGNREIPVVRVMVTSRGGLAARTMLFDGELDLDAVRWHVVRMRGRFSVSGGRSTFREDVLARTVETIAYVELVNREVNSEYWVPQYQRFEAQASSLLAGDGKVFYRILTHFRSLAAEPVSSGIGGASPDRLETRPHDIAIAGRPVLAAYRDWSKDIGQVSAGTRASDFDDVAPPELRAAGPPQLLAQVERLSDLARFSRVEGLFTGLGVTARMRDAAPGLVLRATGGWAWSEHAARGRVSGEYTRSTGTWGALIGRTLDVTNDFRSPFDSGSTLGALFGQDDNDYVDRRLALGSYSRALGRSAGATLRLESGVVADRGVQANVARAPLSRGDSFLPNRGVRPGTYARQAIEIRFSPDLDPQLLRTGRSAVARYERGDGTLAYQRIELRLAQRANRGSWTLATRLDAGLVLASDPPPQQLIEIGRSENLVSYAYKEFAGDQAAMLRGIAMYRLPVLRAPVQLVGRFWLPEPSPALAVTTQVGWTGFSSDAARRSAYELGMSNGTPLSRATGSARASLGVGLRFFGGAVGVMAARALDHAEGWRLHADFNPQP
jgi:hypothetical protein